MRKAAAVVSGVIALIATCTPVFAQGKAFPDVPDELWAADAVKLLSNKGIVIGYPDGTYKGMQAMSRYEFAQAIARLMPLIDKSISEALAFYKPPFPDTYSKADIDRMIKGYTTPDQLSAAIANIRIPPPSDLSMYDTRADVDLKIAALRAEWLAAINALPRNGLHKHALAVSLAGSFIGDHGNTEGAAIASLSYFLSSQVEIGPEGFVGMTVVPGTDPAPTEWNGAGGAFVRIHVGNLRARTVPYLVGTYLYDFDVEEGDGPKTSSLMGGIGVDFFMNRHQSFFIEGQIGGVVGAGSSKKPSSSTVFGFREFFN